MIPAKSASLDEFSIDIARVRDHVTYFASLGSRVLGYPGNLKAAEYIAGEFRRLGLNVILQPFNSAMPIEKETYIEVLTQPSRIFKAYTLWPNYVQTSPVPVEGLKGSLIYVGKGELEDFDGKNVEGSIVLMDFNSWDNWLNAAKLGARAVIFIEAPEMTAIEALKKTIRVPLHFPRLFVNSSVGKELKALAEQGAEIVLHSRMLWKPVVGYNIIGIINGTQYPSDVIVISAHYDSWSIIPALSPAAEDSLGISMLLEIARLLSEHPPLRTVWLVAFSGYWEGLTGPAAWVEKYVFSPLNGHKYKILLHMDLDISSESSTLDALFYGLYLTWGESSAFTSKYLSKLVPELNSYLSQAGLNPEAVISYQFRGSYDWGTQPSFYMLSTEVSTQAGVVAFTLRTQYATRERWFTPECDLRWINWQNVATQAKIISVIVGGLAMDRELAIDWSSSMPYRFKVTPAATYSFVTLHGKVVEFNITQGWYSPIPNALVCLTPPISGASSLYWPFMSRYTLSDMEGDFTFYGLTAYHVYWQVDAWRFDTLGRIVYAVDNGIYGTATGISGGITTSVYPTGHPWNVLIPVFKCRSLTLFDAIDPQSQIKLYIPDLRGSSDFRAEAISVFVYEYKSRSTPIFYGSAYSPYYTVAVVFAPENSRVIVTLRASSPERGAFPQLLLVNASKANPEGSGFLLNNHIVIYKTAYRAAYDMLLLTKHRYSGLYSHFVTSSAAELYINRAEKYLNLAKKSFQDKEYSMGYRYSLLALAYVSWAYTSYVMPLFYDSFSSMAFFTFIIIPSALFMERLFLRQRGFLRIIGILAILSILIGIFYFIHPALSVISSSTMAILSIGMCIFVILTAWIFSSEISDLMAEVVVRRLGYHTLRGGSTSIVSHSISLAIENMRRHRLMTALTLAIIISFATAITALSSASVGVGIKLSSVFTTAPLTYDGIVLKSGYAIPPNMFDERIIDYVKVFEIKGLKVAPRVWFYPLATYPAGISLKISSPNNTIETPLVFLGLSNEECHKLLHGYAIGDCDLSFEKAIILPEALARALDVKIGDKIKVHGVPFYFIVRGIIRGSTNLPTDFDGLSILPVDQKVSETLSRIPLTAGAAEVVPTPTPLPNIAIIPWRTALKLGGYVASIALISENKSLGYEELKRIAEEITLSTRWTTYVGYNGHSWGVSRIATYVLLGYDVVIVLAILSALSTVNSYIAEIRGRRREIYVYASLGLSPRGAIVMFLTETIVYAFIGIVIGYLAGFALNSICIKFGILPKNFTTNYTSFYLIVSLSLIILTCIASSAYPSSIAAKIITPSLRRRWRLPTKPKGDVWEIPLPFRVTSLGEVLGMLRYLKEYFQHLGYERPGYRVFEIPTLDENALALYLDVVLTPLELGLSQKVTISAYTEEGAYRFKLTLKRVSGDTKQWVVRNYLFIDDVRKQLLLWRSLASSEQEKYIEGRK